MMKYEIVDDIIVREDGTSIPRDERNPDYRAYLAYVEAGGVVVTQPEPKVASVTPRQARLALLGAGLLSQVETAVNAAGGAIKISWEFATSINRDDALVGSIATQLSLTEAQIDALFAQAVTL